MTFTEIVFEAGDPRYPLCKHTLPPDEGYGIYRLVDDGQASKRYRVHVSYHGPSERVAEVAREMRALRPGDETEVLFQAPDHVVLHVASPVTDDDPPRGFQTAMAILQRFGLETHLEPVVFAGGRARCRIVVPKHVETPEALRALQEVQRQGGFQEFRILRTSPLEAASHVELQRRILPADHEDLLRLAASMGYYSTPKRVTLDEIARRVGLSISPVHKRLKAAEETLVCAHVNPASVADIVPKRRSRREALRFDHSRPFEVTLRVRSPTLGPCSYLVHAPGAQAIAHMVSDDAATGSATLLLSALMPEDHQAKLLSGIEDRPEIVGCRVIGRERDQLSLRLDSRGHAGYGMAWWSESWGRDAILRPMVFQGADTYLRFILARPLSEDLLRARLEQTARQADWDDHEVLSVRSLAVAPMPPPDELTPRQLEVLRIAHALGYYRTPRGCTLEHVANTLGVSANAIHKNLVLAESKLITAYLAASL